MTETLRFPVRRRVAPWLLISLLAGLIVLQPSTGRTAVRYRDKVFSSVSVTRGLVYGAAVTNRGVMQTLLLDLYQPTGDTASKRAAIVFAHGGTFVRGSRTDADVVKIVTEFTKRGFVVASIDYRVRPGGPGYETVPQLVLNELTTGSPTIRDAQHDMQAAVRYLKKNASPFRIDTARIASAGQSAGAVIALTVNFRPEDAGNSGSPGPSSRVAAAVSMSGAAAPRAIGPLESPIVMFHGTNDTTVPFPLAAMTCGTTTAMANICSMKAYPLAQHSLGAYGADIMNKACAFLYTHMIKGPKRGLLRTPSAI